MLLPKCVKYRRQHRPETTGHPKGGSYVVPGEYRLQATTIPWITSRQTEPAHTAMARYMKRGGKVWIKTFPYIPYTKGPLEIRMGVGKGATEGQIAVVKPGRVLFEVAGVPEEIACEASHLANHKLPVRSKFIRYEELGGETNES